jgi:hypothetical protein
MRHITLSTFSDVERHYNNTDVLVSKYHSRAEDVRPIDNRRRKWERIVKITDRKFELHDGWIDTTYATASYVKYFAKYMQRPPIVWTLKKGAVDIITVRGSVSLNNDTGRHKFLRSYLPVGLAWKVGARGIHTVEYFNSFYGRNCSVYLPSPTDDDDKTDYFVQFKRTDKYHDQCGLVWEHVAGHYQMPKRRVDKEKKAALKSDIHAFFEWMCSVGPLLPMGHEGRHNFRREMIEECNRRKIAANFNGYAPVELAVEIVTDYNHMLRPHLAAHFLARHDIKQVSTAEERTKFKNAYNSWVNTALGLITEQREGK